MPPPRRLALVIAWTGAAIFAASLAWFVYSYLFRFGQPAPAGPVARPLLTNVLLFSAFALHHSVLARSGAKRVVHHLATARARAIDLHVGGERALSRRVHVVAARAGRGL